MSEWTTGADQMDDRGRPDGRPRPNRWATCDVHLDKLAVHLDKLAVHLDE